MMDFKKTLALVGLLMACDKPEQFEHVPEDPAQVIREQNCMAADCVGIVSHSTLDVKYIVMTQDNHKKYAKKFGHDYIFRNNLLTEKFVDPYASKRVQQLGLYWQKLIAVEDALNEMNGDHYRYKWVLWIDPDIFFTNFDVSVRDLVEKHVGNFDHPSAYFVASREPFNVINAGVMLFYNNDWSRNLLRTVSEAFPWYSQQILPEQEAIQDFITGHLQQGPDGSFKITPLMERNYRADNLAIPGAKVLPQRAMNSFYGGWWPWAWGNDVVWEPGDYAAHFNFRKDREGEMSRLLACFKEGGEDYHEGEAYKQCR